jgi:hypothetical protein
MTRRRRAGGATKCVRAEVLAEALAGLEMGEYDRRFAPRMATGPSDRV